MIKGASWAYWILWVWGQGDLQWSAYGAIDLGMRVGGWECVVGGALNN